MTVRACPVCAKPSTSTHRPFCSRRCADVDLQRWFSGAYVFPGASEDQQVADEGASPHASLDTSGRPG